MCCFNLPHRKSYCVYIGCLLYLGSFRKQKIKLQVGPADLCEKLRSIGEGSSRNEKCCLLLSIVVEVHAYCMSSSTPHLKERDKSFRRTCFKIWPLLFKNSPQKDLEATNRLALHGWHMQTQSLSGKRFYSFHPMLWVCIGLQVLKT